MGAFDGIKWWPKVKVIKYNQSTIDEITKDIGHEPTGPELRYLEDKYGLVPDDLAFAEGNLLTTAGLNRITSLITNIGATQAFNSTRGMAGVGDGTTTPAVGDGDLSAIAGATHRWFQAVDASNPTQSNGVITANTTFATGDANFAWNEWCWAVATAAPVASAVFNTATTTGLMLNHAKPATSLGTKTSGSWTLQATITLT